MELYRPRPSMVFTQVQTKSRNVLDENLTNNGHMMSTNLKPPGIMPKENEPNRSIHVHAVGELSLPPNKCKISVNVTAKKDVVQEAKDSVSRRVEYIKQCLSNYGIKGPNVDVYERLTRDNKLYFMQCEINAVFDDFNKCHTFSNLLVEKLDQNVTISVPEFFHDNTALESLRKQAGLIAIHNAKLKAQEMARLVHLDVGRTINIQEEETTESTPDNNLSNSPYQRKLDATLTVTTKVSIQFELKKKKKKLHV